jgi:putative ABC transport system permease protein
MAIPITYNLRSMRQRWTSSIVAVLGVAGTVGVFVAMLSLARGFQLTLVSSGSPTNAMVRRAGATSEIDGAVALDQVHVIENGPGIARGADGPLISPEVVAIAAFPLRATGTDANVQVRGISPKAFEVRPNIHMIEGRALRPGLNELIVGRNVHNTYSGLDMGSTIRFGGGNWNVVGVFDAGGSAFDSEVWTDSTILSQVYKRTPNVFQSVTVRLKSPEDFQAFKDALTFDPKLTVQVDREIDYYDRQSVALTTLIKILGTIIAIVMGIGAVLASLNTMYSAVAERSREIATMRALGFRQGSIVVSFMFEALLISFIGGAIGCLAVLPIDGLTTSTLNFQTFTSLAFAFSVTPMLLVAGLIFALFMGIVGGVPPAIRAARSPISTALRGL